MADIKEYTFTQISSFLRAIGKAKGDDMMSNMNIMRIAFLADDKQFKDITKKNSGKPVENSVPAGWITKGE